MKRKIVKILSICAMAMCLFAVNKIITVVHAEEQSQVVYISANGNDTNTGESSASPYKTFKKALENIASGGTINVVGAEFILQEDVAFENVELAFSKGSILYANGHALFVKENVTMPNSITVYGGGKAGSTVKSTNVTLLSGTYNKIYGGSKQGIVRGDTNLRVGGTVNAGIDENDHAGTVHIYGGGNGDTIQGKTNLLFEGNAKANYVYGGSTGQGATNYGTNLLVNGGSAMSVYGGNKDVNAGGGANTTVTGGNFEQLFGGNDRATMSGDAMLKVLGGTITRRIYGGCYNDTSGLSFSTSYIVSGQVYLTIGSQANIAYSYAGNDLSVYARSRYSSDKENSHLVFADQIAYENYQSGKLKLTAQDSAMKLFVGGLSVADSTHYYSYSLNDNVITQTCAYHNEHSATALMGFADGLVEEYTGEKIKPLDIEYSDDWEYESLVVEYLNNVYGGIATCNISIGTIQESKTFVIVESPTILGGSVRLSAPAGLRFQSKVPETMLELGATFGTLVIPRETLGEQELTIETALVENIEQTTWATNSVKVNNSSAYEEGYEYFNAVLTDTPTEHYATSIVARSYMCLDGVYYYSEEIERSLAQVAAFALQDGYTDEVLYNYVDTALAEEEKSVVEDIVVVIGGDYKILLSGTKNYAAIWDIEDASIVSINNNGELTALREGTTNVTATIGTTVLRCQVTVRKESEQSDNELPIIPF